MDFEDEDDVCGDDHDDGMLDWESSLFRIQMCLKQLAHFHNWKAFNFAAVANWKYMNDEIENLLSSGLWKWPPIRRELKLAVCSQHRCDMCASGCRWKKRTQQIKGSTSVGNSAARCADKSWSSFSSKCR